MIETIKLTKTHGLPEDYLGKFVDETMFDRLVTSDCDVYKPNNTLGKPDGEHNLLLSFRKNVFPLDLVTKTHALIRDAAQESQNRGIAAGPRTERSIGRDWVTFEHFRILNEFLNVETKKVFDNEIVYNANAPIESKGEVFLAIPCREEGFVFAEWVEETKKLAPKEQVKEAQRVIDTLISTTTYANPVISGIAGAMNSYPRIPECRQTTFTRDNLEKWNSCIPFIDAVSKQFKITTPNRYGYQVSKCEKIDQKFRIGKSAYTTVTINKNYRTATHTDSGDLEMGFGNLTTLTDPSIPQWDGCYLVFPMYRVAVDVRPGDFLAMDTHQLHGNTPIKSKDNNHERISIVCYFREGMLNCESFEIENMKRTFIEHRKNEKTHPLWKLRWNGVSPDMFDSEEWKQFLILKGMEDYVNNKFKKKNSSLVGLFES